MHRVKLLGQGLDAGAVHISGCIQSGLAATWSHDLTI